MKLLLNEYPTPTNRPPHLNLAHLLWNLLLNSMHVYIFSENNTWLLRSRRFFQEEKYSFSGSAKGKTIRKCIRGLTRKCIFNNVNTNHIVLTTDYRPLSWDLYHSLWARTSKTLTSTGHSGYKWQGNDHLIFWSRVAGALKIVFQAIIFIYMSY